MYNLRLKIFLIVIVCLLCTTSFAYPGNDTTRIYFKLDDPTIDKQAITKLDSLLYLDIISVKDDLLIVGYADHLGTNTYNDTLSTKRAANVKAYLISMNIPAKHVSLCIGRGEIPRDVELPDGYAADRRVDIVQLKGKQKPVVPKPVVKKKDSIAELTQSHEAVRMNMITPVKPEQLTVGRLFVMDRIFFYTGRHKVVEESLPELEKLYIVLTDNPTVEIRIEGHVCCVPSITDALDEDTREVALSRNRAKFIYNYLVKKGIDPGRLSYVGFGKTRPLRKNEFTQEDQDLNKRVEIRILKN